MSYSFWKHIDPFYHKRLSNGLSRVYSEKEFFNILERERYRADRHNGSFSLVSFNVGKTNGNGSATEQLIKLLLSRKLRKTDEIGWSSNKHIGVVLDNTTSRGARSFANNIYELIYDMGASLKYRIYTYPVEYKNHNGENREFRKCLSCDLLPSDKEVSERTNILTKQVESESHSPSVQRLQKQFIRELPAWKRAMDVIGSIISLIALSPVMMFIMIAIKIDSKGPVLFKQQRSGLGGKQFTFYKFRSMYHGAEFKKKGLMKFNEREGPVFKMANDPRVTHVGKIIRQWSLDELPQLINVLKGDMSLVGPRPPTLDEVPHYENWQNRRLEIKPGITCLWQAYARHDKCFKKWTRLDIDYARRQSLLLDLKILLKTIPAVISRKGAY